MVRTKATDTDLGLDMPDEFFGTEESVADPEEAPSESTVIVGYVREERTRRANHSGKVSAVMGTPAYFFKDVLEMAYAAGLRSLNTVEVQIIDGPLAIVTVEAEFENADGTTSVFTGIGDAGPSNVGKMVAPHWIRMAETRAQGRVLGRALNLDAVTADELLKDGDVPNALPASPPYAQRQSQPAPNSNGGSLKKEVDPADYPDSNSDNASGFECENDKKMIPGKTAYWSVKKYGKYLCYDCQQKLR